MAVRKEASSSTTCTNPGNHGPQQSKFFAAGTRVRAARTLSFIRGDQIKRSYHGLRPCKTGRNAHRLCNYSLGTCKTIFNSLSGRGRCSAFASSPLTLYPANELHGAGASPLQQGTE